MKPAENNLLVVMAGKNESRGKIENLTDKVLFTGIGKVNSCIKLTSYLATSSFKPEYVLNLGTAGSHRFEIGTLIQSAFIYQADMDVTALNFKKYQTPFENAVALKASWNTGNLPYSDIYTADSFIADKALNYPVMDMEAYALAKTCGEFNIPFTSVKYISDAGGTQKISWKKTLEQASEALACFLADLFADKAMQKKTQHNKNI